MAHASRTRLLLPGLSATLALFAAFGCSKTPPPAVEAPTTPDNAAAQAVDPNAPPGAKIYAAYNCARCHMIDGNGAHSAPELTHIGAKHDADWLIAQIKDPKSHKSDSQMPAFGNTISTIDTQTLADYLASLK